MLNRLIDTAYSAMCDGGFHGFAPCTPKLQMNPETLHNAQFHTKTPTCSPKCRIL